MMATDHDETAREILTRVALRLPRYVRLATRLVRDNRLTAREKAPLIGAVGYGVSPIDLIPGIIPVIGQLDDLLVLFSALQRVLNQISPEIANEHLTVVGLSRADLEDDLHDTGQLAKRIAASGAAKAAQLARGGARLTGRLASRGLRAVRNR